jgi:hypothetical protein
MSKNISKEYYLHDCILQIQVSQILKGKEFQQSHTF